jgi:hypothetical protein
MIGVIGVNWLTQPLPDMQKYVDNVASLSVKGFKRMDIISHHKIIYRGNILWHVICI